MGWVDDRNSVLSRCVFFTFFFYGFVSDYVSFGKWKHCFQKVIRPKFSNSKVFLEPLGTVGLFSLMEHFIGSSLHSSPSGITATRKSHAPKDFSFHLPVNRNSFFPPAPAWLMWLCSFLNLHMVQNAGRTTGPHFQCLPGGHRVRGLDTIQNLAPTPLGSALYKRMEEVVKDEVR